jgi:hypothetical protein
MRCNVMRLKLGIRQGRFKEPEVPFTSCHVRELEPCAIAHNSCCEKSQVCAWVVRWYPLVENYNSHF